MEENVRKELDTLKGMMLNWKRGLKIGSFEEGRWATVVARSWRT
jgi:hypothetical protein